jgi:hypothetical protein
MCPEYTNIINQQPRVSNKCPGFIDKNYPWPQKSYPSDQAPPVWTLLKVQALCCPNCPYYKEDVAQKFWWCQRPFSYEVSPENSTDAFKISERSVVPRP